MRGISSFACAAAAAMLVASTTRGAIVWGVDNLGTTNAATVGDRVIRFNSNNPAGSVQVVGATGIAGTQMSGLDFTPNGNLYAMGQVSGTAANLYLIDKTTGAASLVGSTGTAAAVNMTDLAYDPSANRMLALSIQGATPNVRIYTINTNTGNANLLGAVTGIPAGSADLGLSCDSAGHVFIEDTTTDNMYQVSAGGVATALPSGIGADCAFSQGMTIDWSAGDTWYLARTGPSASPFTSDIRTINNTTGATTAVLGVWPTNGTTNLPEYELGDIAIRPTPEPTGVAFLLAAGLAGIARRRR